MRFYSIRHVTRFRYSSPVRESVMELRMQPRSEAFQYLRSFQISTVPKAQLYAYSDHLGNAVYHFNVLREHHELKIEIQSIVERVPMPTAQPKADGLEWQRYNSYNLLNEHYDFMLDSKFAKRTPALASFIDAHGLNSPPADPLTSAIALNKTIYDAFAYEVGVTDASSAIDEALLAGRGVCQDFAHIMIAIARTWGLPARYVSGYLFHRGESEDRSGDDASHAWVEVWLPSIGWFGLDPTNNLIAGERHIRVGIGRDYADVPPTRGTFKGEAETELAISVSVQPTRAPIRHEEFLRIARPIQETVKPMSRAEQFFQQQQQ